MPAKTLPPSPSREPFALFDNTLDDAPGAWLLTGLRDTIVCTDPAGWAVDLRRLEAAGPVRRAQRVRTGHNGPPIAASR